MELSFALLHEQEKLFRKEEICRLLKEGDTEFVPPLSSRFRAQNPHLSEAECQASFAPDYYAFMCRGRIFAALADGKILGFVAYHENYVCPYIGEETHPNIYISSLFVSKEARGAHLTQRMYTEIFSHVGEKTRIFTRTWSTNGAHIRILSKFGFAEIARVKDERAAGIDTVYFGSAHP